MQSDSALRGNKTHETTKMTLDDTMCQTQEDKSRMITLIGT